MNRIKKFGKKMRRTFGGSGRDIGERYGDEHNPEAPTQPSRPRLKAYISKSMDTAFETGSAPTRSSIGKHTPHGLRIDAAATASPWNLGLGLNSPVQHMNRNPLYDPQNNAPHNNTHPYLRNRGASTEAAVPRFRLKGEGGGETKREDGQVGGAYGGPSSMGVDGRPPRRGRREHRTRSAAEEAHSHATQLLAEERHRRTSLTELIRREIDKPSEWKHNKHMAGVVQRIMVTRAAADRWRIKALDRRRPVSVDQRPAPPEMPYALSRSGRAIRSARSAGVEATAETARLKEQQRAARRPGPPRVAIPDPRAPLGGYVASPRAPLRRGQSRGAGGAHARRAEGGRDLFRSAVCHIITTEP